MGVVEIVAVVVVFGGFFVARFFRVRRYDRAMELRGERKDLAKRRHHFRGRPDLELDRTVIPLPRRADEAESSEP